MFTTEVGPITYVLAGKMMRIFKILNIVKGGAWLNAKDAHIPQCSAWFKSWLLHIQSSFLSMSSLGSSRCHPKFFPATHVGGSGGALDSWFWVGSALVTWRNLESSLCLVSNKMKIKTD